MRLLAPLSPRNAAVLAAVLMTSAGLAFASSDPAGLHGPAPRLALGPALQQGPPDDIAEMRWLLEEVDRLSDQLTTMRHRLASTELALRDAQRELTELRQFVRDREMFGDDFAQYQYVKVAAEQDTRTRVSQEARARREQAKADRAARREVAREEAAKRDAEEDRLDRYRNAGFAHLSHDVFSGRMAYRYGTSEGPASFVDYDPFIGLYYRPTGPTSRVDYSSMTLSGSVINATDQVRNIGIAITFFDESGNQVGATTVQVENARPDVPYPFTSKLDMALDRAFSSVSQYVLYSDSLSAPFSPPG